MDRDKAHAALCNHVGGDRAVDAAGEQGQSYAIGAHGHAACTGHGGSVDIGCQIAYLNVYGKLRIVHVNCGVGEGLGKLTAHILAQLDAGHGEGLVAALGLNLEALCAEHILAQILLGKGHDGVLVLFAGGGADDGNDAEDLTQNLHGGVHIGAVVLALNVDGRLEAVYLEFADLFQTAADVGLKLLLKSAAVQALEHQLAQLNKYDVVHIILPLVLHKIVGSVLDGLGEMFGAYVICALHVGNGAGYAQNAVVASG